MEQGKIAGWSQGQRLGLVVTDSATDMSWLRVVQRGPHISFCDYRNNSNS